jgi:hypothetical protein
MEANEGNMKANIKINKEEMKVDQKKTGQPTQVEDQN